MVLTHGIVCSSNPQRPRGGRRCGGKMLWFVKTQTTEESLNAFELYPNPTRDMVNIRYNVNDYCLLEIYDATSRKLKVLQMPAGTQKTTISVSELAPGSYTYKFIVGGVQKKCGKISIY